VKKSRFIDPARALGLKCASRWSHSYWPHRRRKGELRAELEKLAARDLAAPIPAYPCASALDHRAMGCTVPARAADPVRFSGRKVRIRPWRSRIIVVSR